MIKGSHKHFYNSLDIDVVKALVEKSFKIITRYIRYRSNAISKPGNAAQVQKREFMAKSNQRHCSST